MRSNKFASVLINAAFVLFAAFSALGQPSRPDFNRVQTYDVQHYVIRASFDQKQKGVYGETTVSLRPLKSEFRTAVLDAVGLAFESVVLEPTGIPLEHKSVNDTVVVTLDKAYGLSDVITVRFKYTAKPKKGVYFIDPPARSGGDQRSAQIWTQGEPDEARHWFPSFDFPSDKATTEQHLTVASALTVIGNGELVRKTDNANGTTTWHYRMTVPHSTYLVSFVVGKYLRIDDRYKEVPLAFYVYPGREKTAQNAFGDTKRMMGVFEELTGFAYPYNKYDQAIVAEFPFGGMENITATTMADTEIFFSDFEFGKGPVMDLVSHELAHSWFGNLVTCRNWAELWLNEGFATFMEAAYREKINGRGDYIRKIRADAATFLVDDTINRRRHALYNQRAGDVSALFDNAATTYNKGGAVIHTLREQVGDEAFWKGVNIYLSRHRFAAVETTDLRKAMEEASGEDLGWFFDQWVYGAGAPSLLVRQTYSHRNRNLTITVTQTQRPDTITPGSFRLPLDIVINRPGGNISNKILVTKRTQVFQFKVESKPTGIEIDPAEKLPLKKLQIRPISVTR